jgi:hypothetical protein
VSRPMELHLKGAKTPTIMQHTYRCDAIHRGQTLRRSCSRTLEVETDAQWTRGARVDQAIDADANNEIRNIR